MKCSEKNCMKHGKWAPKINVPAKGWPIDMHQPIQSIMTIELCEEHKNSYSIENFINNETPELQQILTMACKSQGKAEPDFDRAWLSWLGVGSSEYIKFKGHVRSNDR